ncbi:MAG TPA: ice-binding family protein, partial [Gemmatimonadaceae bacterium]|nr:ice-binding family protein [Gemmatimonadaceae bacterium]
MNLWTKATGAIALVLVLAISAIAGTLAEAASPAPVALGDAARFAVLASAALTNSTGASVINGNAGYGTAISGFSGPPLGTVTGTTYGPTSAWQLAHDNMVTAYNEVSTRPGATTAPANDLGGKTLTAGFYDSLASAAFAMTSDLTLDGENDPNAVFILRTAAALDTTATVHVNLTRGARACNVYWVVGAAATLGANTTFKGTILAFQAITLGAGATIDGRALSVTAAVTMDSNTIMGCDTTVPTIAAPPGVAASTGPADTSCSAFVSDATLGTATSSDNSGSVIVTRSPTSNTFPVGATTLTYTATDPAGNTASATQLVTVSDNTVPTITSVPANASYQLLSDVPAANANDATATDNCGVPTTSVIDTDNGGLGTVASPLIITRTFTANDAAANSASAVQTITVIAAPAPT